MLRKILSFSAAAAPCMGLVRPSTTPAAAVAANTFDHTLIASSLCALATDQDPRTLGAMNPAGGRCNASHGTVYIFDHKSYIRYRQGPFATCRSTNARARRLPHRGGT